MARWLSSAQIRRQAKWEWEQPTAVGAISPPMTALAVMVDPTINNGAVDPNVITSVASMPTPTIRVDTGSNSPPPLTASAAMPNPLMKVREAAPHAAGVGSMVAPLVWKTVVCYPPAATFTLHGFGPAIPIGSGKFPANATFTLSGFAPSVSSVTPTVVQPGAASFTLSGGTPTLPTGPRFPYQLPIVLN